jgi:hypothetical protein
MQRSRSRTLLWRAFIVADERLKLTDLYPQREEG